MALPKTKAKTVEERRKEIVGTKDNEYLKVVSYTEYSALPEVKPYKAKPENIRFLKDGLETLVGIASSNRAVATPRALEHSPIDTTYEFMLIDEGKKRILKYQIDGTSKEF